MVGADTRFRTLLDKDRSVGALENDDRQARALEDKQARTLGEIAAFLAPDETQLRRTQANILTQLVFTTVGWASMYLVWEALRCNIFTNIQRLNYQSSNFPNIHNTSFSNLHFCLLWKSGDCIVFFPTKEEQKKETKKVANIE